MRKSRLSVQYNSISLCGWIYDNLLNFMHVFLPLSLHRIGIGSTQLMSYHLIFVAHKSESALKTILIFSLVFNSSCQYIMCN